MSKGIKILISAVVTGLLLSGCGANETTISVSGTSDITISADSTPIKDDSEISSMEEKLTDGISQAQELESSEFASDYQEKSSLKQAVTAAQTILDNKQIRFYKTTYNNLNNEIEKLQNYINDQGYKAITKTLQDIENIRSNYFAQYYDTSELDAAIDSAQSSLDQSDTDNYESIYDDLSDEYQKFDSFIKDEQEKIYNSPTSVDAQYPFAVDVTDVTDLVGYQFSPINKQSSSTPTWVIFVDSETTDTLPTADLFINDLSADYTYEISNTDTQEIEVQNEDMNLQTALVNTQIKFNIKPDYSIGVDEQKNMRTAYLINKDGVLELLLQSYDGDTYYIPYDPD